jgi:hypothetical protein
MTLTRQEAIAKAEARASRTNLVYLVTERTDHPAYPGETVHLVIAEQDKRLWALDERCVEVVEPRTAACDFTVVGYDGEIQCDVCGIVTARSADYECGASASEGTEPS